MTDQTVTAASSAAEIVAAINRAGEARPAHRAFDWPKEGEHRQKSWVLPTDIGSSTSKDQSLVKRLKQLTKLGILESRTRGGSRPRFRAGPHAENQEVLLRADLEKEKPQGELLL
ncbi:MAG TPA: hypothetical protein VF696_01120 [Candidatus Paceibacterota bacterium]|jgi:hypothetical protein